jgi:hypothetical protein
MAGRLPVTEGYHPIGLAELGPPPHVPARGQAYSRRTKARLLAGPIAVEIAPGDRR